MSIPQNPQPPGPHTPQAPAGGSPHRRVPAWAAVAGAGVLLLAAISGGFALGAAQGTSSGGSGAEEASTGDENGNGPGEGGAEEAAPEETGLQGQDLEGHGIGYTLPEDWAPHDELPPSVSMELDEPVIGHALVREDGTLAAFASLTALDAGGDVESPGGAAVLIIELASLFDEDLDGRSAEPLTVDGEHEAARTGFRYEDVDVETLLVDAGTGSFATLSVGIYDDAAPDEADEELREAILESVHVL